MAEMLRLFPQAEVVPFACVFTLAFTSMSVIDGRNHVPVPK